MKSKYEEYLICKERGHSPTEIIYGVYPPVKQCTYCGSFYRFDTVTTLIEYNLPKQEVNLNDVTYLD